MKTPNEIKGMYLDCTCVTCGGLDSWNKLMQGAKRADIRKINRLVKIYLPELYFNLALEYYNPYFYYKTKTHLILVHSGIEYFLKYY